MKTALKLLSLFSLFASISASSIGYDTILAIVVVELLFAFAVGVICIIFSFNLFRSLKAQEYAPPLMENLPPRYDAKYSHHSLSNLSGAAPGPDAGVFERETNSFGSDAEMDFETKIEEPDTGTSASAVLSNFTSYLKFW